jgi:hypothetical protein
MSYAPIYAKLHDLEERLVIVELSPKQQVAVSTMSSSVSDFDNSGLRKEIDDLLNIVSDFATKAELPDVSAFATKAELPDVSEFVTKAELADLLTKFDNLINVVSQLNTKLNEANDKISALENA